MCLLRAFGSAKCYDKIQTLEVGAYQTLTKDKVFGKVYSDLFECSINQGSLFKCLTKTHQSMKYWEKV
jgi:hypothetical protein